MRIDQKCNCFRHHDLFEEFLHLSFCIILTFLVYYLYKINLYNAKFDTLDGNSEGKIKKSKI